MLRLVFLSLLGVVLGAVGDAQAQNYPTRPVRVFVPATPGVGSDLTARIIAPALAAEFGEAFVVENRVTSGGIIGTQQVAEAARVGNSSGDIAGAASAYVYQNLFSQRARLRCCWRRTLGQVAGRRLRARLCPAYSPVSMRR